MYNPNELVPIQPMQPVPNQAPEDKPHVVGFKTDEERVIFFQNVAELMFRDGVIKKNTISAFMQHAAFETANYYLYGLLNKARNKPLQAATGRGHDPYNHIDDDATAAQSQQTPGDLF